MAIKQIYQLSSEDHQRMAPEFYARRENFIPWAITRKRMFLNKILQSCLELCYLAFNYYPPRQQIVYGNQPKHAATDVLCVLTISIFM